MFTSIMCYCDRNKLGLVLDPTDEKDDSWDVTFLKALVVIGCILGLLAEAALLSGSILGLMKKGGGVISFINQGAWPVGLTVGASLCFVADLIFAIYKHQKLKEDNLEILY